MDIERFEILARHRFEYCLSLLIGQKHQEYSRNKDKLHNFKVAARMKNETPERALLGMEIKHRVSITDMIDDIDSGRLPQIEVMMEKITDDINYLVLLEGLLTERIADDFALITESIASALTEVHASVEALAESRQEVRSEHKRSGKRSK
jgi:hypothetical protein